MGLVQRTIEAAGISTITLSGIPALTASVGVPRLAAIERPLGYLLGQPGERDTQMTILRAVLHALVQIQTPGTVANLPYGLPEGADWLDISPPQNPPIVGYLMRHPWHIPNFFSRKVPNA